MHEFFICCHSEVSDLQNFWNEKYTIDYDMLPLFVSKEIAQNILEIGKSRILLNGHLGKSFGEEIKIDFDFGNLAIINFHRFEADIEKMKKSIGTFLAQNYLEISDFLGHFNFIKKTIMMGAGDFIDS